MAILITTSRRPARRIRTFCRDLARSIPNAFRVNRGKLNFDGIAEKAVESNANRVIIVSRWKGGSGKIELFQTGSEEGLTQAPPLLYVAGVRLQREFEVKLRPVRSLAVTTQPEAPQQIMKIAESLSNFLKIPMPTMMRAAPKFQASMHVSSDASHLTQISFMLFPEAVEVGPRITVSRVAWEI